MSTIRLEFNNTSVIHFEYAREETHYLLCIDLMKRKLLSSSTDPKFPEASLVELYHRNYDLCMQLYQKEILTENSYLNIYGLYDADLNGQQLAIVAVSHCFLFSMLKI
ncbi:hypothetical protein Hanom_Chr06g00491101 [Helianthus anomalus]